MFSFLNIDANNTISQFLAFNFDWLVCKHSNLIMPADKEYVWGEEGLGNGE